MKSQNLTLPGAAGLDQLVWDRFYLKYATPGWSVTAGKQRIAWGTGYIWNPKFRTIKSSAAFSAGVFEPELYKL